MSDRVFSLSYGIPDECIVQEIPKKTRILAPYIPGAQYQFNHTQQDAYYQMYRDSMFAMTQKKGGWDCLRHYEIMANGCMPIFVGLDKCPTATLKDFPKELVLKAMDDLKPWDEKGYEEYMRKLLGHVRAHLSCSALAKRFLEIMGEKRGDGKRIGNLLMICGHSGVNYSRELLWIGLKRLLDGECEKEGGSEVGAGMESENAVEYPRMGFLYDDFPLEGAVDLYGKGFTYSRRINAGLKKGSGIGSEGGDTGGEWSEFQIRQSILEKKWDVILYGKVGPDELEGGDMGNMPFWGEVSATYGVNEIAFLYGGDECQDMTSMNRYSGHLLRHVGHGICFVREINTG